MLKKIIYIDSTTQLTSTKNVWSNQIDVNLEGDYNRITVLQSQIPVSYYVIGSGANTFTLTEGNASVVITITPANYNVYSFSTTVSALLTANSPNGYVYTITYPNAYTSPDTGLFTYTVNSIAKTVSLLFPVRSPISEQFGFVTGSTNYFRVSGGSQVLTSTNVVNFTPENSIYIRCNFCDAESTSEQSDVLLAMYGNNVQPYSTIVYTNPCPLENSKRLSSRDRNLSFSVCDENALPIYMNGGNIQMTLMFYKDITVNTTIEEYIAMKTRLLELDVDDNLQKEKEQVSLNENRSSQLDAREETLKQREDDLAKREEAYNLSINKNVQVENTNVENTSGSKNQEEVYNDRPQEVLGEGDSNKAEVN